MPRRSTWAPGNWTWKGVPRNLQFILTLHFFMMLTDLEDWIQSSRKIIICSVMEVLGRSPSTYQHNEFGIGTMCSMETLKGDKTFNLIERSSYQRKDGELRTDHEEGCSFLRKQRAKSCSSLASNAIRTVRSASCERRLQRLSADQRDRIIKNRSLDPAEMRQERLQKIKASHMTRSSEEIKSRRKKVRCFVTVAKLDFLLPQFSCGLTLHGVTTFQNI